MPLCRRAKRQQFVVVFAPEIAREAYGADATVHKHRVAAVRAMHSFVRKNPQYALAGGKGRTPLVIMRADEAEEIAEVIGTLGDLPRSWPSWLKQVRRK
jgi:hypothetical protein